MAKDGTNRGGARYRSGPAKKPLADNLMDGNPGKRKLSVVEFPHAADLKGGDMPKPRELLSARQKDGRALEAAEIYAITWEWLRERGCAEIVSPQLIERYALSRKGNPYDSAIMESFYRTLKRELVQDADYDNPEQACQACRIYYT